MLLYVYTTLFHRRYIYRVEPSDLSTNNNTKLRNDNQLHIAISSSFSVRILQTQCFVSHLTRFLLDHADYQTY